MKKLILLLHILVLIFPTLLKAQSRADTISLYKMALKHMHLSKPVKTVGAMTNRKLFENINLSNPSYNSLDTTGGKFWHKNDWAGFLAKIDTSTIKDHALQSNGKSWFKTSEENRKKNHLLSFSPIVFNSGNDKALFVLKYLSPDSGGAIVSAFFEKSKGSWIVKDILQLALID